MEILRFATIAGLLSGIPSTLHALVVGQPPLRATRAAGTLLIPTESDPTKLLVAGALVHAGVTTWWTAVLAAVLPRRHSAMWGAIAGVVIAGSISE